LPSTSILDVKSLYLESDLILSKDLVKLPNTKSVSILDNLLPTILEFCKACILSSVLILSFSLTSGESKKHLN
jgi:hypothetical protein